MTTRTTAKPLAKKGKRIDRTKGETEFTDGNGVRRVARYCDHCGGLMTDCPKCKGVGIVVSKVR